MTATTHKLHDIGVSRHIGSYSDAVEVHGGQRWLFTSGTPGLRQDGSIPDSIEEQTRLAWAHVFETLRQAAMTTADLVKVTTSLIGREYIPAYVKIRKELLGDVRPAFMLSIVTELIKPGVLVEVEIVAAAK